MNEVRYAVWYHQEPIAWFISELDARDFIRTQALPHKYEVKEI